VQEQGRSKEEAVSRFSSRQARAIRRLLEAVRDSGIFFPGQVASDDLAYAIAYWSERDENKVED
jgi:hypothetical protein